MKTPGFNSYTVSISIVLFLIFSNLQGCATMKKDECLSVDWHSVGYEDGAKGYKPSRIARHRKACSKHGVSPDFMTYQKGHAQGLKEYCTPYNGYRSGLNGHSYNDVCQGDLKIHFQEGYNAGRNVYLFERDIRIEQKDYEKKENELSRMKTSLKKMERNLNKDCTNPKTCKESLDAIRDLDRKRTRLKRVLRSKLNLIDEMEQALSDMKAQNRFY